MRRLTLGLVLLAAGCSSTPEPEPVVSSPRPLGDIIGLTAAELNARFGTPQFQVREGPGIKLQYASASCILDAFLYPPTSGSGAERVTYVETRTSLGAKTDRQSCIASFPPR